MSVRITQTGRADSDTGDNCARFAGHAAGYDASLNHSDCNVITKPELLRLAEFIGEPGFHHVARKRHGYGVTGRREFIELKGSGIVRFRHIEAGHRRGDASTHAAYCADNDLYLRRAAPVGKDSARDRASASRLLSGVHRQSRADMTADADQDGKEVDKEDNAPVTHYSSRAIGVAHWDC